MTECNQDRFEFASVQGTRQIVAEFNGGTISSDGGGLLLQETDSKMNLLARFSQCFVDRRNPELIEHSIEQMIRQRVIALALGYEDLNDHDQLRRDPLLALLAGKERDRAEPGAGKSTLNRLELTPKEADATARYKKIMMREDAVDDLLVSCTFRPRSDSQSRWCWIWMPPTTRFTASKRDGSFTATTGTTVTCRCTFLRGNTCSAPGCGPPTWMLRPERWRKWSAS